MARTTRIAGEISRSAQGKKWVAKASAVPASASRADYLKATALECLLGWLYLRGERGRINQLFAAMMEETDDAT